MLRRCLVLSVALSFVFFQIAKAAIVVSNLDESINLVGVTSSSGTANAFTVGTSDVQIDSVILSLSGGIDDPYDYEAKIYDDVSDKPGSELLSLGSLNTALSGEFTFDDPSASVTLSSATTYWLVLISNGGDWRGTNSTSESIAETGWSIGDTTLSSALNASPGTYPGVRLFSIEATVIPEPAQAVSMASLFVFGILAFKRRC